MLVGNPDAHRNKSYHLFRNQISTIDLGGVDGDVIANDGKIIP